MSRSSIITDTLPNPTPGEILYKDFMIPMGLTQGALAQAIGVPRPLISGIVRGNQAVTADIDLRFARYFSVSEGFWLGIQADFELLERRRQIEGELAAIQPRDQAA